MKNLKILLFAFCLLPFAFVGSCQIPSIGGMMKPIPVGGEVDCSTADYISSNTFNISTYEASPRGIGGSPDGAYLYVAGNTGDEINQFTLGTPGDLSTISHTNYKTIADYEALAWGMYINPVGTKLYVIGYTTKEVTEFTLTTAWDITTLTYVREKAMSAYDSGNPFGICFSDDGSFMFYITSLSVLNSFELTTPWDVSTLTNHSSVEISGVANKYGLFISSDGINLHAQSNQKIQHYKMTTPYDISTINLFAETAYTGFIGVSDSGPFLISDCRAYLVRSATPDLIIELIK